MATFVVGTPIVTAVPSVTVDAGLPAGSHAFQLVVTDAAGNRSSASEIIVNVQQVIRPIPIHIPIPRLVRGAKATDQPPSTAKRKPRKKTT